MLVHRTSIDLWDNDSRNITAAIFIPHRNLIYAGSSNGHLFLIKLNDNMTQSEYKHAKVFDGQIFLIQKSRDCQFITVSCATYGVHIYLIIPDVQ